MPHPNHVKTLSKVFICVPHPLNRVCSPYLPSHPPQIRWGGGGVRILCLSNILFPPFLRKLNPPKFALEKDRNFFFVLVQTKMSWRGLLTSQYSK